MMSVAGNSMNAHRNNTSTTAHNLENVNTPGYSRQSTNLRSVTGGRTAGGAVLGDGVAVSSINQVRDRFTEAQIPKYAAEQGYSETLAKTLKAVTVFDPDEPGNIADSLSNYFQHLRELTQSPGDTALRTTVVGAAKNLSLSFNNAWSTLEEHRNAIDDTVKNTMTQINQLAEEMANLNGQIRNAVDTGYMPNDLMDQRIMIRDELANMSGATYYDSGDGSINLALPNGTALVNGLEAAQFDTTPDPDNDGHLKILYYKTDGSGPFDLNNSQIGGAVGGYLEARDTVLADSQTAIDNLAFDVGTEINNLHFYASGKDATTHNLFFSNISVMVDPNNPYSAGVKGVDISDQDHSSINLTDVDTVNIDGVDLALDWSTLTAAEQAVVTGDYSTTPMTPTELNDMAAAVSRIINDAVNTHNTANPTATISNADVTLNSDGLLTISTTSSGANSQFDIGFGSNSSVLAQLLFNNATTNIIDTSSSSSDFLSDNPVGDNATAYSANFDSKGAAIKIAFNEALATDTDLIATADTANVLDTNSDGTLDYTPNGDASILFQMLDLQNKEMVNLSATPNGGLNEMITIFGVSVNAAEARDHSASLTLNHLNALRESISGVSIDEELINLEKSQRAYQAVMKIITVSDEMMDTLMRIK
jgi:flagellar hook-associated protein 1 FlgK